MKAHQWSRRSIVLAAVVAIVASTSGFALASVMSPPTPVGQEANFYQGTSTAVPGYTSPALQTGMSPGGCSPAYPGMVTDSTSGGTAVLVLSAWTAAANCSEYDFAEVFTFQYLATTSQHVDNFTIYTSIGANPVQTNFVHLELGPTSGSSLFGASIVVYVDYGAVMPPTGGVTNLELVISHP